MRPLPVDGPPPAIAIGQRLRAARQSRHLTINHVAELTGFTKGFLSRVERDQTSPSVATLVSLCAVLDVQIGDLFAQTDAQFVALKDAPHINLGARHAVERLLSPRREGRMQVIRSSVEPGGDGGEVLYAIGAEIELVHVVSGTILVEFADREWPLVAGDSLTFDASEPHNWRADPTTGAELLWVLVPAVWNP